MQKEGNDVEYGIMSRLARWYKNSLCSIEAQSNIRSMSSFFVRLFVLDDAIRYSAAQNEINQDISSMEVEKNGRFVDLSIMPRGYWFHSI